MGAVCWACAHRASTTATVNGKRVPACNWHAGTWKPLAAHTPPKGATP